VGRIEETPELPKLSNKQLNDKFHLIANRLSLYREKNQVNKSVRRLARIDFYNICAEYERRGLERPSVTQYLKI